MIRSIIWCIAVMAFYGVFYRTVVSHWGRIVSPTVTRLRLDSSHSTRDIDAIGRLAAATIAQLLFVALMMISFSVSPLTLCAGARIDLLLVGAILGVAEFAFASFVCATIVSVMAARGQPDDVRSWLAQGRGGWMSQFSAIARSAPRWFGWPIAAIYVALEEVMFRGATMQVLRPAGVAVAVTVSALLFVIAQRANMPSWRGAMFPMIGAVIVGGVHGALYWLVPDVLPLVVAHMTFFATALSSAMTAEQNTTLDAKLR
jgi:hypothetical protein